MKQHWHTPAVDEAAQSLHQRGCPIAMISTWKMSLAGLQQGMALLQRGAGAGDAVTHAIECVEADERYTSVGYGGLPDRSGHVTLDAAYMDGRQLRFGAVMAVESVQHPIQAARALCGRETNCLLAGRGAEQFAIAQGLAMRPMLTKNAREKWAEALQTEKTAAPYAGHDTVCVIGLDEKGNMVVGTSTSGLFMKEPGRVGDSPIVGSGFYCDAEAGAAAATGLGEDVMRGCLSYEVVSLMRHGATAQEACEEALHVFCQRKRQMGESAGSISLIALHPCGQGGASTTLPVFPFAYGCNHLPQLYAARQESGAIHIATTDEQAMAQEP